MSGNEELYKVLGINTCSAKKAHIKTGNNMLELFEFILLLGKKSKRSQTDRYKFYVHGYYCTIVCNDFTKMNENSVRFLSEPIEFRSDIQIFYFYGSDIELCEMRES